MITLTILNADGSLYWTEYFNDIASAQAWIADEQTRPYWVATRTYTIVDNTPVVDTASYAYLLNLCYQQRLAAYPPVADFLDGQVKASSSDPTVAAAGQAQIAAYQQACLAVKAKYPLPINPTSST